MSIHRHRPMSQCVINVSFFIVVGALITSILVENLKDDWKTRKDVIDVLLDLGLNVNDTDRNGNTVLTILLMTVEKVKRENCPSARKLEKDLHFQSLVRNIIGKGTETLNVANNKGQTALYFACRANTPDTLQQLINNGCDIMHRVCGSKATMMHACSSIEGYY